MKSRKPRTEHLPGETGARRPFIPLLALAGAAAIAAACRKPPPDEIVYTGGAPRAGGASSASVAASTGSAGGEVPSGEGGGGGAPAGGEQCGTVPVLAGPFSKARLLTAIADCTLNRACEFEGRARALRDSAVALARGPSEESTREARRAWLGAVALWQEAEVFRFGPAARSPEPGSQDLRDQIYAWPLVNRCKIEEQIVDRAYAERGFSSSLVNARGLAAFEYLVFYGGSDNACSQFSTINANSSWTAIEARDLAQRKADYAAAVAEDVLARAGALARAWALEPGGFRAELVGAGAGSQVFATEQDALNAVSDALFYIDKELKDYKLGRPLGLSDCFTATCPEALESRYAQVSTAHLRANLVGFRRLFEGCGEGGAGIGFDDWLRAVGASELAERMLQALSGAQSAVAALDPPLEQALASDPAKVRVVYDAVKVLTDSLKTEFVTVLNLELPRTAEGDTD
jgi:uncharacterized protein